MFKNVHSSSIDNHQNLKTDGHLSRKMHLYFTYSKLPIHSNTDESQKHSAEQKKSYIKQ